MAGEVVLKRKLVDRSAFGEIWKVPAPPGISGDVYHVIPPEGRLVVFMNDRGTLCTMTTVYVSHLCSARKLIGKAQMGKVAAPQGHTRIPAAHVVSYLRGEQPSK